ncbi:hypothetical protein BGY98DRAFT_1104555 [Russula aff. rugulosa BPL654]|nr:hypothetical protein BGY98DRAFT_1104555 [Russula aff. rugulosa BPL654]
MAPTIRCPSATRQITHIHRLLAHTQAYCCHMQLPADNVGVHGSPIHHSAWFLRVPTSSTLQPLASPTTLAGLDYPHYPHTEAFGMPVPSIHCSALLGFHTSTLAAPMVGYTSAVPTRLVLQTQARAHAELHAVVGRTRLPTFADYPDYPYLP